jgi:Mn2+/Fe2+ NRAMP family transporter
VVGRDPVAVAAERQWLADLRGRSFVARHCAYLCRGGPGYLQSALTLGGGTASACLLSGAAFGTQLLWVMPLGMLLGAVVFAAIAHQTLSSDQAPYAAMRQHAGRGFAFCWAGGTIVASVVWHFAQYSLASAVLQDLLRLVGCEVPRFVMGLAVLVWAVPTALGMGRGGRLQRLVEVGMRWLVWGVVAMFALVAVRVGSRDPAALWAGFVPQLPPDRGDVAALPVVLAGLATAVGVNMTFLYPYTLRARGFGREHREYARADLMFGMVVPYVLATSLMVVVAAGTLYAGFSGRQIGPLEAAATLEGLLGPWFGRLLFDLGILGMVLTTITMHMVSAGLAAAELGGVPLGSRRHQWLTLLPVPGVLGSVYWGSLSVWLAVPTSIVAGALLPVVYAGFWKLLRSRAYLGADRPTGLRGGLWQTAIAAAIVLLVVFLALYVHRQFAV